MAYRAFFALPTDLATASGQVTNAVYGFTSMLINLFKDHHPDGIAVAFDRPEPTFRHDLVDDYKAGRAAAPDILRQQMGLVRQVVETLKIPIVEIAGFEADDVIATLATQARDRGDDVIVVTGDRDAYQLVEDPHVKVLYNRRGVSDYVLYDEAGILERTGRDAAHVPAVRRPAGRPVRQPAGRARGGGEDGGQAAQHLRRPRRRLRQRRQVHAQAAGEPDRPRAGGAAQRHRHPPRARRRPRRRPQRPAHGRVRRHRGPGAVQLPRVQHPPPPADGSHRDGGGGDGRGRGQGRRRAVGGRRAPGDDGRRGGRRPAGAGPGEPGRPLERRRGPEPAGRDRGGARRERRPRRSGSRPSCWPRRRSRPCWPTFPSGPTTPRRSCGASGLDLRGLDVDTAIAAYLIDPAESQYLLDDLAARFLGVEVRSPDAPPPGQLDLSGTTPDPAEEAGRRAVAVGLLVPALAASMDARGLRRLYDEVERPLVRVLARMEAAGVRVDVELLRLDLRRAGGRGRPPGGGDPGAGRRALPGQLHARSCAGCCSTSSACSRRRRPRPASPPTPRPWRSCGACTRSSSRCSATGRWRSSARPTASRCWPRSVPTAASTPPSTRRWPAPAA